MNRNQKQLYGKGNHADGPEACRSCVYGDGAHLLFLRIYRPHPLVVRSCGQGSSTTVPFLSYREIFTYPKPEKYFETILCITVPMELLLLPMRFAGWMVQSDGFYLHNTLISDLVILLVSDKTHTG